MKFAVLGLGDSSYRQFNFAGKKLFRRLKQLGASELLDIALADDQHEMGADYVIDEFCKGLWKVVETMCEPLPKGLMRLQMTLNPCSILKLKVMMVIQRSWLIVLIKLGM